MKNLNIGKKEIRSLFLPLCVSLIASRVIATYVFPLYDDAYITMRYARNLAEGYGFVFNKEEWVLGLTCPGFGLLESLLTVIGIPLPVGIQYFNILCDVIILWFLLSLLLSLGKRVEAILFSCFFILSPIVARICVGGMEMNLFLLLSLLSIYLYTTLRKPAAIILAASLYNLRPEALILVTVLLLFEFAKGVRSYSFVLAGYASIVLLLPLLILYVEYGAIVPQSVIAKSHWHSASLWRSLKDLLFTDPLCIALFPFAIVGVIHSMKGKNVFLKLISLWFILYCSAFIISRAFVYNWYGEVVHVAEFILAATSIPIVFSNVIKKVTLARLPVYTSIACCSLWYLLFLIQGSTPVKEHVYSELERWSKKNGVVIDTLLAGDIGAVGYYSNAYIYDTDGLIWPKAVSFRALSEPIAKYRPKYLYLVNSSSVTNALHDIRDQYKIVRFFSEQPEESIGSSEKEWIQRYVLLKRISP